jgi:hypothetical protein
MHPHTATCPMAPDHASRLRLAPALPHALRLWTSHPGSGQLWRCHVSYGSGPRLSAKVGSDVVMCPMALDLASWLRWALVLPSVLWLRTLPPGWGGLQRCHVSHGSMWAASLKNKEKPSGPACTARHACFQCMHASFQGIWHQGHHGPTRHAGRQRSQFLQGV